MEVLTEERRLKAQFGDVGQHTGLKFDLIPAFAVPAHCVLVTCPGIDILEDHLRHSLLSNSSEIVKAEKVVERDLRCVGGLKGHSVSAVKSYYECLDGSRLFPNTTRMLFKFGTHTGRMLIFKFVFPSMKVTDR